MSHCIVQSDIHEKVCNFCKDLYHNKSTNPFLLAYLVDLCDEMIQLNLDNSFFNIKLALQVRMYKSSYLGMESVCICK